MDQNQCPPVRPTWARPAPQLMAAAILRRLWRPAMVVLGFCVTVAWIVLVGYGVVLLMELFL